MSKNKKKSKAPERVPVEALEVEVTILARIPYADAQETDDCIGRAIEELTSLGEATVAKKVITAIPCKR